MLWPLVPVLAHVRAAGLHTRSQGPHRRGLSPPLSPSLPYLPCLAQLPLTLWTVPPQHARRQGAVQDFIEQLVASQLGSQGSVTCRETCQGQW